MSYLLRGALVLLSLAVFSSARSAEIDPDDEHYPLCEAYVFSDRAEFLFPVLDDVRWRWNRKESRDNKPEYAWELKVPADNPKYGFGVYLYKSSALPVQDGSLQDLLALAKINAFQILGRGERARYLLDKGISVGVHLEYDGVVVTLKGAESVNKIFSSSPKQVLFNLLHPSPEYAISCRADVQYRSGPNALRTDWTQEKPKMDSWSWEIH